MLWFPCLLSTGQEHGIGHPTATSCVSLRICSASLSPVLIWKWSAVGLAQAGTWAYSARQLTSSPPEHRSHSDLRTTEAWHFLWPHPALQDPHPPNASSSRQTGAPHPRPGHEPLGRCPPQLAVPQPARRPNNPAARDLGIPSEQGWAQPCPPRALPSQVQGRNTTYLFTCASRAHPTQCIHPHGHPSPLSWPPQTLASERS